jgi:hypothetical protein
MTEIETPTWEFEPADPEVGFLSDTITHTCAANLDEAEPAEETDRTFTTQADGKNVVEVVVFTCPACKATTTGTNTWPIWMFEEPRDEEEGR